MSRFVTTLVASMLASCTVNVSFDGEGFRCTDGSCPEGLRCNADRLCVSGDTGPDASLPPSKFEVDIDVVGADTGSLTNFPLRVRLDETRINFADAAADGSDVFFSDQDGTKLEHEIESWSDGDAELWVLVPTAQNGTRITLHYGSGTASVAPGVVWTDYRSVFHLTELADATDSGFEVVDVGTTEESGVIGRARGFASGYVDLGGRVDFLRSASSITISAWVRRSSGMCSDDCTIFGAAIDSPGSSRSRVTIDLGVDGTPNLGVREDDSRAVALSARGAMPLGIDEWAWVAATVDAQADRLALYVNGEQAVEVSPAGLSSGFDSGPSERVVIGVDEAATDGFFLGAIDEVRVRLDARDTAWVEAQYASLTDALLSFGPIRAN